MEALLRVRTTCNRSNKQWLLTTATVHAISSQSSQCCYDCWGLNAGLLCDDSAAAEHARRCCRHVTWRRSTLMALLIGAA
jgi:hypothetical protein